MVVWLLVWWNGGLVTPNSTRQLSTSCLPSSSFIKLGLKSQFFKLLILSLLVRSKPSSCLLSKLTAPSKLVGLVCHKKFSAAQVDAWCSTFCCSQENDESEANPTLFRGRNTFMLPRNTKSKKNIYQDWKLNSFGCLWMLVCVNNGNYYEAILKVWERYWERERVAKLEQNSSSSSHTHTHTYTHTQTHAHTHAHTLTHTHTVTHTHTNSQIKLSKFFQLVVINLICSRKVYWVYFQQFCSFKYVVNVSHSLVLYSA